jgi:UDP-MurNAc hydroxylase
MVYDYPPEQERKLAYRKRMAKLAYVAQATRACEPRWVLPFAGPPVFLDPDLRWLNAEMDGGIFPDPDEVAVWMRRQGFDQVRTLFPGDVLALQDGEVSRDPRWVGFAYRDADSEIEAYAARRAWAIAEVYESHPAPTVDLWPTFEAYFSSLVGRSTYFDDRIAMKVGFEIRGPGGGDWSVDFRKDSRGVYADRDGVAYDYALDSRWLVPILDGRVPWEDFLLSCRFEARRDPDVYNDHLLGLLKFADKGSLDAVEAWETSRSTNERIEVRAGHRVFEIQRFCPHAGQDLLESGEVLHGEVLRCSGHHYEFDLLTGRCLTGAGLSLVTRVIRQDAS